jgi:HTH-type transcriptional regulator/antitoxin HigA
LGSLTVCPDPIEAIKFRLAQQGNDTRALIGIIGGRTRVHEVLHGQRSLLNMIRNLHDELGIPAHVLVQPARKRRDPLKRRSRRRPRRHPLKKSA